MPPGRVQKIRIMGNTATSLVVAMYFQDKNEKPKTLSGKLLSYQLIFLLAQPLLLLINLRYKARAKAISKKVSQKN